MTTKKPPKANPVAKPTPNERPPKDYLGELQQDPEFRREFERAWLADSGKGYVHPATAGCRATSDGGVNRFFIDDIEVSRAEYERRTDPRTEVSSACLACGNPKSGVCAVCGN